MGTGAEIVAPELIAGADAAFAGAGELAVGPEIGAAIEGGLQAAPAAEALAGAGELSGVSSLPGGGPGFTEILAGAKTAASILSPVASLVGAGASMGAARRGIPGPAVGGVGAPSVTAPVSMPTAGGPLSPSGMTTNAAVRTSVLAQVQRRGRASTILTQPSDVGDRLGS